MDGCCCPFLPVELYDVCIFWCMFRFTCGFTAVFGTGVWVRGVALCLVGGFDSGLWMIEDGVIW